MRTCRCWHGSEGQVWPCVLASHQCPVRHATLYTKRIYARICILLLRLFFANVSANLVQALLTKSNMNIINKKLYVDDIKNQRNEFQETQEMTVKSSWEITEYLCYILKWFTTGDGSVVGERRWLVHVRSKVRSPVGSPISGLCLHFPGLSSSLVCHRQVGLTPRCWAGGATGFYCVWNQTNFSC